MVQWGKGYLRYVDQTWSMAEVRMEDLEGIWFGEGYWR